jgi:hypothetical protein
MIATALLCVFFCSDAAARPGTTIPRDDRYAHTVNARTYQSVYPTSAMKRRAAHPRRTFHRHFRYGHRLHHARRGAGGHVVSGPVQIVAHPAGCPSRAFCGCGVARYIFGTPIRALWLAAAWLRYPPAAPAPGMVAVRSGHVFAIVAVRSPSVVLAYDPNSGGHRTRIHLRSLAGYRVVNPKAS